MSEFDRLKKQKDALTGLQPCGHDSSCIRGKTTRFCEHCALIASVEGLTAKVAELERFQPKSANKELIEQQGKDSNEIARLMLENQRLREALDEAK